MLLRPILKLSSWKGVSYSVRHHIRLQLKRGKNEEQKQKVLRRFYSISDNKGGVQGISGVVEGSDVRDNETRGVSGDGGKRDSAQLMGEKNENKEKGSKGRSRKKVSLNEEEEKIENKSEPVATVAREASAGVTGQAKGTSKDELEGEKDVSKTGGTNRKTKKKGSKKNEDVEEIQSEESAAKTKRKIKKKDLKNEDGNLEVKPEQSSEDEDEANRSTDSMLLQSNKAVQRAKLLRQGKMPESVFTKVKGRMASDISILIEDSEMKAEAGHTCILSACRKLGKNVNLKDTKNHLYINLTTGFFVCNYCQKYGSFNDLVENTEKILDKKAKKKEFECFPYVHGVRDICGVLQDKADEVLKSGTPVQNLRDDDFMQMKELFDCQSLTKEHFEKYKVTYSLETSTLNFPFYTPEGDFVGVNQLSARVAPPEDDEDEGEARKTYTPLYIPKTGFQQLFGWSYVPKESTKSKKVVLTCTELDAMIITQETDMLALALPSGSNELSVHILPSLESIEQLVMWDRRDRPIWDVSRRKKLSEKRCLVFGQGSHGEMYRPLQAVKEGLTLWEILKSAKPLFHGGIADSSDMRTPVTAELLNFEQACGVQWSRFPILNHRLKGLRPGELTVFTGQTGSGKTTFLSEYSLDLCLQGVNTLWGSFEISNTRLIKMMLFQLALENISNDIDKINYWYDKLETLPMKYMTFHSQQNIQKVLQTLEHGVYMHDIDHVIIDNLQFMMGVSVAQGMDKFTKQDLIISTLRRFATEKNCHVTLVIHPRKESPNEPLSTQSIFGGAKASQEADNILILQEIKVTPTKSKKYLEITKNRFAGDLGIMTLNFHKDSLTFSQNAKKGSVKAHKKEENKSDFVDETVDSDFTLVE